VLFARGSVTVCCGDIVELSGSPACAEDDKERAEDDKERAEDDKKSGGDKKNAEVTKG